MEAIERAAGQPAHEGAVDPDVLQVVAGVLLDEPDGALGTERANPIRYEVRDPTVIPVHELDRARLEPAVELRAQRRVPGESAPALVQPFDDPFHDVRFGAGEI